MNNPVNYEVAELLNFKSFDKECKHYYDVEHKELVTHTEDLWKNSEINKGYPTGIFTKLGKHPMISAPLIADVLIWLYDNYGIWIYSRPFSSGYFHSYIVNNSGEMLFSINKEDFNSPSKAYEVAIFYTLNNLIN